MSTIPDPTRCVAEVADRGRFTHWFQCSRSPAVELQGYKLCKQHAKQAQTDGALEIVFGPSKHRDAFRNHESHRVLFEKAPELVQAERTRRYEQAVKEFNKFNNDAADRLILDEALRRHPDPDLIALRQAAPVEIYQALKPNDWQLRHLEGQKQ